MCGVEAAYYLVHSLAGGHGFRGRDLLAARNFAAAAKARALSASFTSAGWAIRRPTCRRICAPGRKRATSLRETGVPVTEFRAAVIVGSGSLSFEMIRYLTERLPVMICPRWVYTRIQPIAIRNVLDYLVAALDTPASAGRRSSKSAGPTC